jgi:hypothetical protein
MLVTPLPWVNRNQLLDTLRAVHQAAGDARQSHSDPDREYFRWCENAVMQLTPLVTPADIDRLVLTQAYWTLMGTSMIGTPQINSLRLRELDRAGRDLGAAIDALQEQVNRWQGVGILVVSDTNFFMNYPQKFDEIDYFGLLDASPLTRVRVVIPMPVIDELDGLKKSKMENRWRAAVSLPIISRIVGDKPTVIHELRPPELLSATRGHNFATEPVTMEILFDPPGHSRLEIMDDEIVRRAVSVQPFVAASPVTMLTYDTNMVLRAQSAGLYVLRLGDEKERQQTEVNLSDHRRTVFATRRDNWGLADRASGLAPVCRA